MTPDEEIVLFCRNIRYLRKRRNLTQKELAQKLHIGVASLRKIEREECPPRLNCEVLFFAQDALGVPAEYLLSTDVSKYL